MLPERQEIQLESVQPPLQDDNQANRERATKDAALITVDRNSDAGLIKHRLLPIGLM
jgi:hypothetical protein